MNFNAKSNSSAPLPKRKSLSQKEKARARRNTPQPAVLEPEAQLSAHVVSGSAVQPSEREVASVAAQGSGVSAHRPSVRAGARASRKARPSVAAPEPEAVQQPVATAAFEPVSGSEAAKQPAATASFEPIPFSEPAEEPDGLTRRRVADIRRKEREERARRARRRYTLYVAKIIGMIVLAAGLIIGAVALYSSDFTAIEKVQVEGAEHLTDEEVTQAAQVPAGSTLLRLDKQTIIDNLVADPWVASATITREFPNKIVLHIEEEEAAAVVRVKKNWWIISKNCTWLSLATKAERKQLMKIRVVSSSLETPVAGAATEDSGVVAAVQLLSEISVDYRDAIKSISAESEAKLSMKLVNGVQVAWGSVEETELKEAATWALLEKYEGTISYINVRVASKPTFRTSEI